jgi:hypothetical protein
VDWIKFVSEENTISIARQLAFEKGATMLHCQVFDMNGQLVKSAKVMAGSASEAWNKVNDGLINGAYIMRYGAIDGRGLRNVQVKK